MSNVLDNWGNDLTEDQRELMEAFAEKIEVVSEPWPKGKKYKEEFEDMSRRDARNTIDMQFFRKREDELPEMVLFCLQRKRNEPLEFYAFSEEGRFKINKLNINLKFTSTGPVYSLEWS